MSSAKRKHGASKKPVKKMATKAEPAHSREAVTKAISDAAAAAKGNVAPAHATPKATLINADNVPIAPPAPPTVPDPEPDDLLEADAESESELVDEDQVELIDEPMAFEAAAFEPEIDSEPASEREGAEREGAEREGAEREGATGEEAADSPAARQTEAREVATQIRELEARLDRMIDEASRAHIPLGLSDRAGSRPPPPPSSRTLPPDGDATVFDTARELLSTDFYLRKWGRLGMRNRSEEVDDFGFDPIYEQKVLPFFNFLYEKYFRVETDGIERIPSDGRCLLVANHSGTLPYDGVMIKTAVKRGHPAHRDVRW